MKYFLVDPRILTFETDCEVLLLHAGDGPRPAERRPTHRLQSPWTDTDRRAGAQYAQRKGEVPSMDRVCVPFFVVWLDTHGVQGNYGPRGRRQPSSETLGAPGDEVSAPRSDRTRRDPRTHAKDPS